MTLIKTPFFIIATVHTPVRPKEIYNCHTFLKETTLFGSTNLLLELPFALSLEEKLTLFVHA
jgi:hypothetical protein